jgi:SAM-dependent methyltransferase
MNWWEPLYDDLLAELLLERADVDPTLDFLWSALDLTRGARVLDQCCGIGSVAIPLAARGARVVGVDQSARYVERARSDASRAGVEVELAAADARTYLPPARVDAAFNWWTSFGYADDESNARMLERAWAALVPGGAFALDFMNVAGVLRGFQRSVVDRKHGIVLVRETEVALDAGVMKKRWTYFLEDGRRVEKESAVRLYMPHDLAAMLRAAGFADVVLYGDVNREPLRLDSPRCIAVARRPR